MERSDGSHDSDDDSFEVNLYIDVILKCVLLHAGTRKIFFSTFNPDVCTMWARTSTLHAQSPF